MVWIFPLIWVKQGENDKWCPERKMTLLKGRLEQKKNLGGLEMCKEKTPAILDLMRANATITLQNRGVLYAISLSNFWTVIL